MGNGGGGAPTAKWTAHPSTPKPDGEIDPKACEARLIVRRPDVPEVEIAIEKNGFLIGRMAAEVDLVLDDDLVSRRHAMLSVNERGYFRLEDCGSKNGITYQGRTVKRLNLLDGDEFSIGKTDFVFHANIVRYAPAEKAPEAREDSVMVDVDVPIPSRRPAPEGDEPVGWDPARAKEQGVAEDPAEAPPPGAPETPPAGDEEESA